MSSAIDRLMAEEQLPPEYRAVVDRYWRPLSEDIAEQYEGRPLIVGVNGAQGSGKSTMCRFLEVLLVEHNQRAVTLSLDDLYLALAERSELAASCHPLFATRGVPGTHEVALGEAILDALMEGRRTVLPRFDKATDDRATEGTPVETSVEVILLEGWCVGAAPQAEAALREPVNALERDEDPEGVWRREVNRRLATDYAQLFGRLDLLVMLQVGSFEAVRAGRRRQEDKLAARRPAGTAIMDDAALDRFLMHYERLTRWMLEEMPARANVVIEIGVDQQPCGQPSAFQPGLAGRQAARS
jgi:D-glycerate 3-kinase